MPDQDDETLITDVPKLQTLLTERKDKLEKYRTREAEKDAELAKYREAEAARAAKEKADTEKKTVEELAGRKQYEDAIKAHDETWTKKDQEKTTKFAKKLIPSQVQAALAKTAIIPQAMTDASSFMESQVGIDPETFDPFIKGPDGKPLVNKDTLARVSIEEYAAAWVEARPHFKLDQMASGNGHKPGAKGAINTNPAFTVENAQKDLRLKLEWQKADPSGYRQAMADADRAAYQALRSKKK